MTHNEEEEVNMLQEVEDEFARAAELAPHMQLIFPAPNAASPSSSRWAAVVAWAHMKERVVVVRMIARVIASRVTGRLEASTSTVPSWLRSYLAQA